MGKPKPKPVVVPTTAPAAESKDPESDESKSEQKIDDKDTEKKWIYEEHYGWEQQNRLRMKVIEGNIFIYFSRTDDSDITPVRK